MKLPAQYEIQPVETAPYRRLKDYVIATTGLAYYQDKDNALIELFDRRLSCLGIRNYDSYLQIIRSDNRGKAEFDALITELTIGETFFFRYTEQFDALRDNILPECIERNSVKKQLRIWSAGCANGAELYSIAILLCELLSSKLDQWEIRLIGTDINPDVIRRAKEGLYNDWMLRDLPPFLKDRYFTRPNALWKVKIPNPKWLTFSCHNLIRDPIPSLDQDIINFDLVLCRNVMIYFDRTAIKRLAIQLRNSLVDGGWLLVGHAEPSAEFNEIFLPVSAPGTTLYRKTDRDTNKDDCDVVPALFLLPAERPADRLPKSVFPYFEAPQPTSPAMQSPTTTSDEIYAESDESQNGSIARSDSHSEISEIEAFMNRGLWPDALNVANSLLKLDKLNPCLHFQRGLIMQHMGEHLEAEACLRRSIYLDRNFALAHYQLGMIRAVCNDVRGAKRCFLNTIDVLQNMTHYTALKAAENVTAGELLTLAQLQLQFLARR